MSTRNPCESGLGRAAPRAEKDPASGATGGEKVFDCVCVLMLDCMLCYVMSFIVIIIIISSSSSMLG